MPNLKSPNSFPVVGIGASAGGLEALTKLISHLPEDTGMAFVIIQHLDRSHESHLTEILSRSTKIPVSEVIDGVNIKQNHIYIIPPNFDLSIKNGALLNLHSRSALQDHHVNMTIDFFFESLAESKKNNAIGIVLSGTASDGTIGLKLIKAAGGIALAQDPQTAKFDGMPRSAIASGVVDLILSPEEIGQELGRMAKHPYISTEFTASADDSEEKKRGENYLLTEEALRNIFSLLKSYAQVDFSSYKPSTVKRRIQRQMMLKRVDTVEKYIDYLKSNPEALKALYDDLFIHVTEFFRDLDSYKALENQVFPALSADKENQGIIRIWVPGCSTGEEAYSLAISLIEFLEKKASKIEFQIFATDISEVAIQVARKGFYSEFQAQGISEDRQNRFFDRINDGYKIKKFIRDTCIFSRHDVINNPPFARLNLVSCRNLLIYFTPEIQKRVIPIFHYALNPNGFLWLGKAEAPSGFSNLFSTIDKISKIYCKIGITPHQKIQFPSGPIFNGKMGGGRKSPSPSPAVTDIQKNADQMVLFKYSPSAVIINGDFEVLQFRGRTTPFLEPSPGLPNHNVLKMAHPDILSHIRILAQSAKKKNGPVRKEGLSLKQGGKTKTINIEVAPLNPAAPSKERQFIILFEDTSSVGRLKTKEKPSKKSSGALEDITKDQYVLQLQQELDSIKEDQQALVEEYESTQEELTSSNEELQSTNEELQSTNEELGTAKEELQATNEELSSLNDELQTRNAELGRLNDDLEKSERHFRLMVENVQGYAFFMVDKEGRVTSWNEGAQRLKGYRADEIIGHHFSKFYPPEDIKNERPEKELKIAFVTGHCRDEGWRVRKDGSRFWANVILTTIYDAKRNVSGFANITRDLTEGRLAEEKIRAANEGLESKIKEKTQLLEEALKSRDEFLSIASHELKTPLTSLALRIQMTKENIKPEENKVPPIDQLARVFDISDKQVKRLTTLVETLLDVSRIQTGKIAFIFEEVNITEIVNEMVDRFSEQIKKANCKLEMNIGENIFLKGDQGKLEQIIENLLSNIVKYAPESTIKISLAADQRKAKLVVEDNGPGIPREKQSKIFDRYERAVASKNISGLGLGLFIVREVVKGHNGSITLDSDGGKGAKFTVNLPLDPSTDKIEE